MSDLFSREKHSAEFNSKDHQAFNAARFAKFVEDEAVKFCASLPPQADFILMQDLSAVGVKTFYYFIAGVPAVRKITVYEISSDNTHVRLDAEFDVPVTDAASAPVAYTEANGTALVQSATPQVTA